jgi:hypothetical protein
MEWISVKDGLPKTCGIYLITDGNTVTICEFKDGFAFLCMPYIEKVAYWMPLPEPPDAV